MTVRGLLCDLDGVVYRGDEACPGAVEGLSAAREAGVRVLFMTNNASRTPQDVAEHPNESARIFAKSTPKFEVDDLQRLLAVEQHHSRAGVVRRIAADAARLVQPHRRLGCGLPPARGGSGSVPARARS